VLGIIAGADPHDPTALQAAVPDYLAGTDRDLNGVRIGVDPAYTTDGVDAVMVAALEHARDVLAALGAELRSVKFPDPTDVITDWAPQCAVETAVAHAATFPSLRGRYGPGLAGFIDMGRDVKALDLQQIWQRRRRFCGRVAALFDTIDLLLVPAQPMAPLTVEDMKVLGADPNGFNRLVRFTAPFDTTGSPALTLPAGFTPRGLPLAVQLIGRHLDETLLVRAGRAFQRETDWHRRHPPLRS
jgi:amidase